MTKQEELTNPNSCMNKAHDCEMTFVLLARDPAAAETIRFWINLRVASGRNLRSDPKILEAEKCIQEMERQLTARNQAINAAKRK